MSGFAKTPFSETRQLLYTNVQIVSSPTHRTTLCKLHNPLFHVEINRDSDDNVFVLLLLLLTGFVLYTDEAVNLKNPLEAEVRLGSGLESKFITGIFVDG